MGNARFFILFFLTTLVINSFGQVPEVLWTRDLLSHCYGSPACADIDFDGRLEIVFGTYFDDEHAYALNAEDGSLKWRFDVGGGPLDAAPVIADVDLDDSLEVIMPASWGIIYCLSGEGEVEWQYPASGWIECIDSPPAIGDVDGDDKPEVVFGAWYGMVYVLNGEDGSLEWSRCYCDDGYVQSAPCILDCNLDGHLDIVVAMFRGDCKIYALEGATGDTIWTRAADDWMYAGAATADIDLDNRPELVIGDYSGKIHALNAEDGSLIWSVPIGYYVFPPVTIAELVEESFGLEILAAEYELYCLSAAGDTLWIVPTGGLIDRGAVVAEIDGDPGLEVVFGSSDASLYVVNGEDGSGVWEFFAGPGYAIENAPIVEDFDEDGWVDIFFIGGHGTSDTVPNFGRAYAIKSGPGNGDVWTMYRHDPYRTGYLLGGPVTCINEHPVTPATFSIQTWPNPFNGSVTIIMNIINELSPRLRIISLNGEEIINEELKSGYFIWLPDPQLSSGIYLVNAQMGKEKVTGKIVYIK